MSTLSENAQKILENLPQDGTGIGNMSLMARTKMEYDAYFQAKLELIQNGKALTAGGRGGSIKKVIPLEKDPILVKNEKELYPIFQEWIEKNYALVLGNNILHKTLIHGKRKNTGTWSNPDFAYIYVSRYGFFRDTLEICSFELKKSTSDASIGIYEALAHKAFAHQAYLVFQHNGDEDLLKRIEDDCKRFEIGIILYDGLNFEVRCEAELHIPNLSESDEYIQNNVTSAEEQNKLRIK